MTAGNSTAAGHEATPVTTAAQPSAVVAVVMEVAAQSSLLCPTDRRIQNYIYSPYTNVGTDPPTNVAAMQIGLTSFTVSWTSPNPTPIGYVVFFEGGDDEGSMMVDDGSETVVTVDGRVNNRQYSITMVALSLHLPSTVTSSETVMLCKVLLLLTV